MTDAQALSAATVVDVTAYLDVVVDCRTVSRTPTDFRAYTDASAWPWNDGTVTADEWRVLYDSYAQNFGAYLHDSDAIAYRDQRKRRGSEQRRRR